MDHGAEVESKIKKYIQTTHYLGQQVDIKLDPNALDIANKIYNTYGDFEFFDAVLAGEHPDNLSEDAYLIAKITSIDKATQSGWHMEHNYTDNAFKGELGGKKEMPKFDVTKSLYAIIKAK